MRNKSFTPLLIVAGIMVAFALIFAVSVDVYDALFWARLLFTLVAIVIAAFSVFSALRHNTVPQKIRSFCILVLYAIAMLVTLVSVSTAKAVVLLSILLCALYILMHFLDAGINKQNR